MVVFQDCDGLVFYPAERIASVTPTFPGRWRVVAHDGTVGYRPDLPAGPWVALGASRVAPQWLQRAADRLLDPGGFDHPKEQLEPVDFPEAAQGSDLPCPAENIWAWQKGQWLTDQGAVEAALSAAEVLRRHPDMRAAKRGLFFNRRRLRRLLRASGGDVALVYDNGEQHGVAFEGLATLKDSLELAHLFTLQPYSPALWTYQMRDFPFELNACDGPKLRQLFPTLRELIANFLWQAIYYRRLGRDMDYGTQIRGFWYTPLWPALARAGFITRRDKESARLVYEELLTKLIGEERLFDYSDLGFEEEGTHFRRYGPLPVVLMVEKESLLKTVEHLLDLGICATCTGGTPRLISSEHFAKGLLAHHSGPVIVIAFVDHDPGGRWAARTLVSHLRKFGVDCAETPLFLVTPQQFKAEELELYALPLDPDDPRAEGWFSETGGIGGERRIIHANWLRPPERVRSALLELLRATSGAYL